MARERRRAQETDRLPTLPTQCYVRRYWYSEFSFEATLSVRSQCACAYPRNVAAPLSCLGCFHSVFSWWPEFEAIVLIGAANRAGLFGANWRSTSPALELRTSMSPWICFDIFTFEHLHRGTTHKWCLWNILYSARHARPVSPTSRSSSYWIYSPETLLHYFPL